MLDQANLTYAGGPLDRAGTRRGDPDWLGAVLADPRVRVVPMWRDQCLVAAGRPLTLVGGAAQPAVEAATEVVFLGLDGRTGVFATDLSALDEAHAAAVVGADGVRDVRAVVATLPASDAAIHAYARALLHWHRHQQFCGACGSATDSRDGGHLRVCRSAGCTRLLFPRIEPAVIALIEAPGFPSRCLLARHAGTPPDSYSLLAGFVEVGESLEDAVAREVAEEAGVRLTSVTYQASQPWPFPAGLMVGFRATAATDEVAVDGHELHEARWFTRDQLRERAAAGHRLGRRDSVDRYLLRSWLDEETVPTPD